MWPLSIIILILNTFFMLISVAFITLLERKILGFMQFRLGPNKVGTLGILQPFSDAIKLYTKEINWPTLSNFLPFFMSPCTSLILSLLIWSVMPYFNSILMMKLGILMFLSILGMGVYPILIAGWSSNSNYSLIGGMRSLAQTISYEVSLVFILLFNLFLCSSLNIMNLTIMQKYTNLIFFLINFSIWMISIIAELNRTPFDFAEGESELVSGFNTEYSSGLFAIIFMAEYMMIIFFSTFTSVLFLGTSIFSPMILFYSMMFMFFFIWTRATFPRYRYDKLMLLCWKIILPLSIAMLFYVIWITLMIS